MAFKLKSIQTRITHYTVALLILIGGGNFYTAKAQSLNIKNDVFWHTKNGLPINSQGGGIFQFADPLTGEKKYYWYGVHYAEADAYRNNPSVTQKGVTFESVTCYSSTDLVNWTFEADVLTKEELKKQKDYRKTWVGRLGVAYIPALKKYASLSSTAVEYSLAFPTRLPDSLAGISKSA